MKGALHGIKVVDLTRVIAGPYCSMILGDFGAEIIKVEKKGVGDLSRAFGPHYKGESTYFMTYNRNKKSIAIDFRHPKANEVLLSLIKDADVLVENYKAGTLESMGLAPEKLLELNPRLIITRLSGFGQDGPYSKRTCFDAAAQSLSGLMDITGDPNGDPVMMGIYVCDMTSGLYGVIGTLAALAARSHTGRGQVVDVALLDVACALTHSAIFDYYQLGKVMKRNGNQDRASWPASFYKSKDGRLVFVHAGIDDTFAALCRHIGREDILKDENFRTLAGRTKHINECDKLVADWIGTCTADEVVVACEKIGVTSAVVNNMAEMAQDKQLKHRKMIREVEHPVFGKMTMSGPVVKMSDTPADVRYAPPSLGQNNKEIFANLGYSNEEIAQMESEGVI